jgi:hypothetical protein
MLGSLTPIAADAVDNRCTAEPSRLGALDRVSLYGLSERKPRPVLTMSDQLISVLQWMSL